MKHEYRLEVVEKKNGSFDYKVVEVATGKVIGTRNSFRRYVAATVTRGSVAKELAIARRHVADAEKNPTQWSADSAEFYKKNVAKFEAMLAKGEQLGTAVMSYNSKATPPSARQLTYIDFVGFAVEAPAAQA
jgi:hypothetical protein